MLRWADENLLELKREEIGEYYGRYRLHVPEAERAMARSLERYGQLSPVVVCRRLERYELIDGFKRLSAARAMPQLPHLSARLMEADERTAKAAIYGLNRAGGRTRELEEAWIIQALVREDGLSQVEVAELLGRHKSWVCRRLALIERLSPKARDELRVGLLSPTAARQIVRLPEGNQAEVLETIRREALSAARLVHPNIVQVFDSGFDESAHQHFIVMEYVPGQSCAEILRDRGHLDVEQAVDIVTQACRGLDYAHRNGVVHRDVKPGNLLVSESGVVKLADFGIARATGQSSITQVGSVLGTAAYLSPEQASGEEAGPQADLYSLGVVTYQLLSGRLPYEANSLAELALKQQRESPIPLQRINPAALSPAHSPAAT